MQTNEQVQIICDIAGDDHDQFHFLFANDHQSRLLFF